MLIFVLLFSSFAGHFFPEEQPSDESIYVPRIQQALEEKLGSREQVWSVLEEKRALAAALAILGIAGILVLFLGIVFLFGLTLAKLAGKEIINFGRQIPAPAWSVGDVGRVVVLFLFFSHCIFLTELAVFSTVSLPEHFLRLMKVLNGVFFDFVGLAIVLYFVMVKYRQRLISLGLTFKNWTKNASLGVGGYILILPPLLLVRYVSLRIAGIFHYETPLNPAVEIFWLEKRLWLLFGLALFVCLFGPLIEEIFFRGFVYNAVKKQWGRSWAIVSSSVFFALLHLNPVDFFPILILGILLAYIYEKTGSLLSALTVHVLNNSAALFFLFLLKELFG